MKRCLLFVLAGVLMPLAAPAARAFTFQPLDSSSVQAAMTEGTGNSPAIHDDGNGTVTSQFGTSQFGDSDSSLSFGTVWQSSRRPGYQTPWLPDPALPPDNSDPRQ